MPNIEELESSPRAQAALSGARLVLTQLSADAETLLREWQGRIELLQQAEWAPGTSAIQKGNYRAARQEIARCKRELEGLLKLWEVQS